MIKSIFSNFSTGGTILGLLAVAGIIGKFIVKPAVREFVCQEKQRIGRIISKRNSVPLKTIDAFKNLIRRQLERIDSLLGKPFSFNTFLFSILLSSAYPIVIPFTFWVFTGENWSRVDGFAGYGFLNDNYFFRLLIFCFVIVLFAVLMGLAYREVKKKVERKALHPTHYISVDIIVTFGLLTGVLFREIPLLYLVFVYILITFGGGLLTQNDRCAGLYVVINVLRCSIVLTVYLILADMLNWNHEEDWKSTSLIFVLSAVARLLQHFLTSSLKKLMIVALEAKLIAEESEHNSHIRIAVEALLLFGLNFILLGFGNFNANSQMLRPLASLNVFMLFFPMVNAVFDYLSFSLTRKFLKKYTSPDSDESWILMTKYFLLDLVFAFLCLVLLTVCTAIGLSGFNHLFARFSADYQAVDIRGIISTLESNPKDSSLLWLYIMIFSTFVPTLLHIIVFLSLLVRKAHSTINQFFSRNDNEAFNRYISELKKYNPNDPKRKGLLPHSISWYLTKRFIAVLFSVFVSLSLIAPIVLTGVYAYAGVLLQILKQAAQLFSG